MTTKADPSSERAHLCQLLAGSLRARAAQLSIQQHNDHSIKI